MNTAQTYHTETLSQTQIDRIRTLSEMLRPEGMDLRNDMEWLELVDHIDVHKYLINQEIGWTVSWDDAIFSWYENVYRPMRRAVELWEVRRAFPHKTGGQRYLAITTHWHYLKERDSEVTPEEAARDFAAHYGSGLARWFSRFLQPAI